MDACFQTLPDAHMEELRSRLGRLYGEMALDALRSQFRETFPQSHRRRGISRSDPEFSDIVASVMSSGMTGLRLVLLHKAFPRIAVIDVRCPRPQLVATWSRCLTAAVDYRPKGKHIPSKSLMDKVAHLRVGTRISEVTSCLLPLGLHVAIGKVAADEAEP